MVGATSLCLASDESLSWPKQTRQTRPWAYWWWMGSAVDKTNLTKELSRYRDAGMGGVHIIPIYGAKGWEDKYISYLSPQWMEMLGHTVSEANRLNLGVDMTTGTGWCFGGGPNVGEKEGNAVAVVETFDVSDGKALSEKLDAQKTQALVAYAPDGRCIKLTDKINADGTVNWTAPGDGWRVYAISQKLSSQKVKRAAPGGEGPMLNLFYPDAMRRYLGSFTKAFDQYKGPKPRAQYHDSYEYKSDWSPDFFAQFEKRRGYRLQTELPALFGTNEDEHVARVKSDYRETVSDIMAEETLPMWVKWSHQHGFITRNEAHGSPGNLLDLYAVADVPETEVFRTDRNPLISKFASSAAHVTGKNLVSAETCTWLKEHFTETLADVKYLLDEMFVSGVNHVFYHGTCYSPDEADWPGWVFYASTQINPRNSIWRDVPAINAYISRCQSVLQSGKPDNDILLYWPVYDFWHNPTGRLTQLQVETQQKWFHDQPIGRTAKRLWERGFAFDYVSDRQLVGAKVRKGNVEMPGEDYRVVVVPQCEHMPLATLKKLFTLAKSGATVIFEGQLPKDVPGLGNLEKRSAEFSKLLDGVKFAETSGGQLKEAKLGKGRMFVGGIDMALAQAGVAREPMVDHAGLFFIRRSFDGGYHYFIANRGGQKLDGWVTLACKTESAVIMDALNGRTGIAASRQGSDGNAQVYLQLEPGESVILRAFSKRKVNGPIWNYWESTGQSNEITGEWNVKFIAGGPELPPEFRTAKLASWTQLGGEEAQRFAGTARYSITFDIPSLASRALKAEYRPYFLNVGKVCQSARVRLNGHDLGTLTTPPFRMLVDGLNPKDNVLEVEVTSVAANRIRDLDRRGVKWKNFHDINFVNQDYRPFDASSWPLYDCGLLGPVTLTSVSAVPRDGTLGQHHHPK